MKRPCETGERERVVIREYEHPCGETDPIRCGRGICQTEQWGHPCSAVMRRDEEMLADPERIEAERLGASGEVANVGGLIEREVRPRVRRKVHAELHFGFLVDDRLGLFQLGHRQLRAR
jgi:hypothetical protein